MSSYVLGALVGILLAVGALIAYARPREATIARRVLPQVRVASLEWQRPSLPRALPDNSTVRRLLDLISSDQSVEARLAKSGSPLDLAAFRFDQVRWAGAGVATVLVFGMVRLALGSPISAPIWLLLCGLGAAVAVMARDYQLTRSANARVDLINQELPVFAELLAFTVAAGLAPASAFRRVADKIDGQLARELRSCGDDVATGMPFADALQQMADRIGSPDLQRFVDGVVIATQRGTPIADVLRAQAMDARAAGHRALMEEAGRREIFALVPVVFLVLPVVVVVAVYPGVMSLSV